MECYPAYLELQPVESQGLPTYCWPLFHLSSDRDKRASVQLRGDVWSTLLISQPLLTSGLGLPKFLIMLDWDQSTLSGIKSGIALCYSDRQFPSYLFWYEITNRQINFPKPLLKINCSFLVLRTWLLNTDCFNHLHL